MRVRAIVYDFDNTLVQTKEYVRSLIQKVTSVDSDMLDKVLSKNIAFEDVFSTLFGVDGPELLEKYRALAKTIPYWAVKGGPEFVKYFASKKVIQCVLTNRTKMIEQRLDEAGYPKVMDMIVSPQKQFRKPSPRAFDGVLEDLEKMGITKDEVICVGDHEDDATSAKGAGIAFFGVNNPELAKNKHIFFPDFVSFLSFVERIN